MSWSGLFSFIVGVLLAIALLAGGSVLAGRYLATKLTAPPPKPIFPNDKSVKTAKTSSKSVTKPRPAVTQAAPTPTPKQTLPAGAYQARVNQQIGLVLRDSPSFDSTQIGGLDYNERVVVLEESSDKVWQRVRVESGGASRPNREGWIKSGNVERTQ